MWKCVSRRLKDTLERSVSYFQTRNADASIHGKIVSTAKPLSVCTGKYNNTCWSSFFGDGKNKTKNEKWYCGRLYNPWIDAITWSSALVLGWYTSQLLCLSNRKYRNNEAASNPFISKLHPLAPFRYVYSQPLSKQPENSGSAKRQNIKLLSQISLISNESGIGNTSSDSDSSNKSIHEAADKFSDVLSAIENKLGLSAIENGDANGGISLLKSAASRNHAPSLYNLGLCYENGLGIGSSENMAMQYYRAAAILEHPTAMYNLAIFYGQGRGGLKKDKDTALRLLRMAASKGQKEAISLLEKSKADKASASKPYQGEKYLDSPTRIFLQMIGANSNDIGVRREELIY